MKSFLLAILGFASLILAAPMSLDTRQSELMSLIEKYVFNITMDEFIINRKAKIGPAELDWTSDACTSSADSPLGFDFKKPCYRHDFAYRNFKKQHQFTHDNKLRIDSNFKKDMWNACKHEKHLQKDMCKVAAVFYYGTVSLVGNDDTTKKVKARITAA